MMKLVALGIRHASRDEATRVTQFRLVTTKGWMSPTVPQEPPSFFLNYKCHNNKNSYTF